MYRYTIRVHKIKDRSWVSVQRMDVRPYFFVLRGLQIMGHHSHSWWGILHLGAGEMAPKYVFIFCSSHLI
jgi:hypothetical protein